MTTSAYTKKLRQHYESYFGVAGQAHRLLRGPTEKLLPDFFVLEIPPNSQHAFWAYCTVGMSPERIGFDRIELVIYSPRQDESQVELLTVCASYHQNVLPLNLHHTVNFGRPWLDDSILDHGFISLPYLDGEVLEIFQFGKQQANCYWLIPITAQERDYKSAHGSEALEQVFEDKHLDYLDPRRASLVLN